MSEVKKSGRGGARPGTGPKPRPKEEVRQIKIEVRVNEGEHARLKAWCEANKLDLSTWIRTLALENLPKNL